ncbi:MAG TPA: hypothetical protein VGR70_11465 [Stellaceae bacterium]|nr:hypothetical protein [Stellaceae bacterium]
MAYSDSRKQAATDAAQSVCDGLAAAYLPGRQTVILLPGGMGSQLNRSPTPYAGADIPLPSFVPFWITAGTIFDQNALELAIDSTGADKDDYIVVADGPLRFIGLASYEGTQKFFQDQGLNYAVFGYDWRRDLQEAALNLHDLLVNFQAAVTGQGHPDPLPTTSLLCHSQGGMVAKIYLDLPNSLAGALQYVITIATPFYGTGTHMQRYFVGDSTLNLLYNPDDVATITGGLPGPYVLMPMDRQTWQNRGGQLGVASYPVLAPDGSPADPYDQGSLGGRYPAWMSGDYLEDARQARLALDADLSPNLLAKVFHLLSDSTPTPAYFRWAALPAGFDPRITPCPLVPDPARGNLGMVGGDGTVPAFSAALAQAGNQALTVPTTQQHQDLAENARCLQAVGMILANGTLPSAAQLNAADETYSRPPTASPAEVQQTLSAVGAGTIPRNDPRLNDPAFQRGAAREFLK